MQYIITSYSCTNNEGCQRYFDTISRSGVVPLVIQFRKNMDSIPDVIYPADARVYKINRLYPGNTGRLLPIYDLLTQEKFNNDDWFIFTDTHDVIFQKKIPDLNTLTNKDIIVTPEDRKFREISFWGERSPRYLHDQDIYNVGLFAMKLRVYKKFLEQVKMAWINMVKWKNHLISDQFPFDVPIVRNQIAATFNSFADTIIFNTFLMEKEFDVQRELFGCLRFSMDKIEMIKIENKFYTKEGKLICVVHANGGK